MRQHAPHLKALLISACAHGDAVTGGAPIGICLLKKPFTASELQKALDGLDA